MFPPSVVYQSLDDHIASSREGGPFALSSSWIHSQLSLISANVDLDVPLTTAELGEPALWSQDRSAAVEGCDRGRLLTVESCLRDNPSCPMRRFGVSKAAAAH
jgi:hypothetical protein